MLVASTSVVGFNCTTPAASSSRTPPSRPRASRVRFAPIAARGGQTIATRYAMTVGLRARLR